MLLAWMVIRRLVWALNTHAPTTLANGGSLVRLKPTEVLRLDDGVPNAIHGSVANQRTDHHDLTGESNRCTRHGNH
jgi:hypothetical protein